MDITQSILLQINVNEFLEYWTEFCKNNAFLILLIAVFLTFVESLLPALPLVVIVSYNIKSIGVVISPIYVANIIAIVLSALGSFIGSLVVFLIVRYSLGKLIRKKAESNEKVTKAKRWLESRSNLSIILLLSIPYIPTSVFNIAFSLTDIKFKRYAFIMIIAKLICISILGFLNVVFNIHDNPMAILWILLTYVGIYVIIYIVKKVNLKSGGQNEKNN